MKTTLLLSISILITTVVFAQSIPPYKIKGISNSKEQKVFITDSVTTKTIKNKLNNYEILDDVMMKRLRLKTLNKSRKPIINMLCVN